MAHPNLKESRDGHNSKLRRMTTDYGSASGPANNKLAPTNQYKGEGPEEEIGFGSDSTKPRGRADRSSRKQMVSNPVATLKRGGRVRKRDVGGTTPPESDIEQANVAQSLSSKRANGGRTKGKGATHVNVIVAPQGGNGAGAGVNPVPPVLPAGANPAMPPPTAPPMPPRPPMMPPGAGMPPGAMMPPGTLPPGMPMRARGGKVKHADEKQDVALIHSVLKNEGLERSDKPVKMGLKGRASGGRLPHQKHHMEAGAATGEGRLEKIGKTPRDAGRPQAV